MKFSIHSLSCSILSSFYFSPRASRSSQSPSFLSASARACTDWRNECHSAGLRCLAPGRERGAAESGGERRERGAAGEESVRVQTRERSRHVRTMRVVKSVDAAASLPLYGVGFVGWISQASNLPFASVASPLGSRSAKTPRVRVLDDKGLASARTARKVRWRLRAARQRPCAVALHRAS